MAEWHQLQRPIFQKTRGLSATRHAGAGLDRLESLVRAMLGKNPMQSGL
jgi:hypothetical protein